VSRVRRQVPLKVVQLPDPPYEQCIRVTDQPAGPRESWECRRCCTVVNRAGTFRLISTRCPQHRCLIPREESR
jgi:hypothetical protein